MGFTDHPDLPLLVPVLALEPFRSRSGFENEGRKKGGEQDDQSPSGRRPRAPLIVMEHRFFQEFRDEMHDSPQKRSQDLQTRGPKPAECRR